MNILLIIPRFNLTNEISYSYLFPIGMGYIASAIKNAGYELDCINLNHVGGRIDKILNPLLNSKNYSIVLTGGTSVIYTMIDLILNVVSTHPSHPKTILGGLIITTEPEVVFKTLKPDLGVVGEGEETVVELLDCLKKNKNLKSVRGIIYMEDNGNLIKTEKREAANNIDSLPFPDLDSLGYEAYLENLRSTVHYTMNTLDYPRTYFILGSRSCPFQCTFCYHDNKYRERSIGNIFQELQERVKKYRINLVFMYDDCFSLNHKRVYGFCDKIKKLQEEVGWEIKWATSLTVRGITLELLKAMKDAGCISVGYGFESYSVEVLKSMRKPITPKEIDKALKYTFESKIAIAANFIFGDIMETKETANETLNYYKQHCKGQIGLGFIQPYPGTEIYNHCIREGIIKNKSDFLKNKLELLKGGINMTYKMTDKEINMLNQELLRAVSKHSKFTRPFKIIKLRKNIYNLHCKCPFCGEKISYENLPVTNKFYFGFFTTCKRCFMRFFLVSSFQRIAYRYYFVSWGVRENIRKIENIFKKRKISIK